MKNLFRNKMLKVALGILVGVFALISLQAGGDAEEDSHHHDADHHDADHHEHAEKLPDIDAVRLRAGQKLVVVASTSIIGDVVANVGGEAIDLTVLMERGQNPHSYEPSPSALANVEKADIIFVNGFNLEEGLLDAIEDTAKGIVVPLSAGITPIVPDHEEEAEEEEHSHGAVDPHVWLDPTNVMAWVENIEYTLSHADPDNHDSYHAQAEAYSEQLERLDASMREKFSSLPASGKKLVTDHHLFGYFAEEYGFTVAGAILPSTSTSAETSARQIADLVELLRKEGINAIFVGSTAGRGLEKLAQAITSELGEEVSIVDMLTGSLSEPGSPGDTYIGYMEYNVSQIMAGLTR